LENSIDCHKRSRGSGDRQRWHLAQAYDVVLGTDVVRRTYELPGRVTDILHAPPLYTETLRLGYPPHFSTLLGAWKVLGAVALLAPGYPLVKEWAYAGFFIDFSAAVVAYAAAGDGVVSYIGPVVAIVALITSWYLRPASRGLHESAIRYRSH
jgi:hypothetical protein